MKNEIILLAFSTSFVFFSTLGAFAQTESQPIIFSQTDYDTAALASAVNHFVELGETVAVEHLKKIASQDFASSKVDITFRVACVSRILWENDEVPIAAPRLGMYGGGISVDRNGRNIWPKYPVAKSGDSYFIVVHSGRGGTGLGSNGRIAEYIDHCQANGTFLASAIPVPNSEESTTDLANLLKSERWQNAKGTDEKTLESLKSQLPTPGR